MEHGVDVPFENVTNPKKQASKILQYKNRFAVPVVEVDEKIDDNKKFDILVEALGGVVKDYMDKN